MVNNEVSKDEKRTGTNAEACAYLMTVSMIRPMSEIAQMSELLIHTYLGHLLIRVQQRSSLCMPRFYVV